MAVLATANTIPVQLLVGTYLKIPRQSVC